MQKNKRSYFMVPPPISGHSAPGAGNVWYWAGGALFLFITVIALTKFTGYYLQLMTVVAVGGCGILFYLAGIQKSLHLVLLSLPLSLTIPVSGEHQVMFPSELLIIALGISVLLYWIKNADEFILWCGQPLTLAIAAYLVFLTVSVFFSEMVMVSIKSALIKILYIISFYGGGFIYFRKHQNDDKFIGYYLFPLLIVIAIVLFRHSGFEFSKDVSGFVTRPFYRDHTIYSAALAFMLPLALVKIIKSAGALKLFYSTTFLVMILALVFAASRAAWLSVIISIIMGLLILMRFPRSGFVLLTITGLLFVFTKSDDLLWLLKSNRYDSGARHAGIEEQTRSVANITNDQSNAERINRWKCAVRMFLAKPYTGFGPGTYQFTYFPFQRESEMTRISVKTPYNIAEGRGGTAHNEFLLVLSESGVFAALFFMLFVVMTIISGVNACYQPGHAFMAFAILSGFITFVIHSLFNNFLDTDKTAVLFYLTIAFFAALQHNGFKQQQHDV